MGARLLPTFLNLIYVVAFFTIMGLMQVDRASEMYRAAIEQFETNPWRLFPARRLKDVSGPLEVYLWMQSVFINTLFRELAREGDPNFCSDTNPCAMGQGHALDDGKCASASVKGYLNCPQYIASRRSCCEPCRDNLTGNGRVCKNTTLSGEVNEYSTTTSVYDLSENCKVQIPAWLEDLSGYRDNSKHGQVEPFNATLAAEQFLFCPERLSTVLVDTTTGLPKETRAVKLANYNRALMTRITMKRMKFRSSRSAQFSRFYPRVWSAFKGDATSNSDANENKEPFGTSTIYRYSENGGYLGKGGFVQLLDLANIDQDYAQRQLGLLKDDNWFDLNQGSLVIELLLYNGNVDKFLYVQFVFQHTYSGTTDVAVKASSLQLSMHSDSVGIIRFILYGVIVGLFVYFLKNEVDEISADWADYFTNVMAILNLISLMLTLSCIISYLASVLDYDFFHFALPFSLDADVAEHDFSAIVDLAMRMENIQPLMSINAALIYLRLSTMLTGIVPDSGLVFNAIHQVRLHLGGFFLMFVLVTLGFTFTGHYLFGQRMQGFSNMLESFVTVTKAILACLNYSELTQANPQLAEAFFFIFHLFFLVVQQPMLSIILYGYFTEKNRLSKLQDTDRYPLRRFLRQLKVGLRDSSTFLNRIIVSLQQILFGNGDGGTMRINYEQVAALRDRRATQPRKRSVRYEQRGEEKEHPEHNDIWQDVKLDAKDPFYPGGMMQYYVVSVKGEGAAEENKVLPGFRLVGIQRQRGVMDREMFRDEEKFKRTEAGGYSSNTEKILSDLDLPVTLEFEGAVRSFSWECICMFSYAVIFLIFCTSISRISDTQPLTSSQASLMTRNTWVEYNPERDSSFDQMVGFHQVQKWAEVSIIEAVYRCEGNLHGEICQAKRSLRKDWFMWSGVNSYIDLRPGSNLPLQSWPPAAGTMSIGYIPFTFPANDVPKVETQTIVRVNDYNVGVMPNNFMRVTIQLACFVPNKDNRLKAASPVKIHPRLLTFWTCSLAPCMKTLIEHNEKCLAQNQEPIDMERVKGLISGLTYVYGTTSTYMQMGGISLGIGNTALEVKKVWNLMHEDYNIIEDAASMVFESVTFNGNLDLFTYGNVRIDRSPTGLLIKKATYRAFPLNAFSPGRYEAVSSTQQYYVALFVMYIILCAVLICFLIYDLLIQYNVTKELQRGTHMFMWDFFMEDPWNYIVVTSTVFNILTIVTVLKFLLFQLRFSASDDGRFFRSWTLDDYVYTRSVNMDEPVDTFNEFQILGENYDALAWQFGVNSVFMMLRATKYFGAIAQPRLIMLTLFGSVIELVVTTFVILMFLLCFAFIFHMKFGVVVGRLYGTLALAALEMFNWLCGNFDGVEVPMGRDNVFVLCIFTIFAVTFYVLLTMYLAALAYRWQVTRRDAEPHSIQNGIARCCTSLPRGKGGDDSKGKIVKLDRKFWRDHGILALLDRFDETGRIRNVPVERDADEDAQKNGKSKVEIHALGDIADNGTHDENGNGTATKVDQEDKARRFLISFQKAHMDIASRLCREPLGKKEVIAVDDDRGGGLSAFLQHGDEVEELEEIEEKKDQAHEESMTLELGIIEEPVEEETKQLIHKTLMGLLAENPPQKADNPSQKDGAGTSAGMQPAEEIWLDALVTALEAQGTLKELQTFFLPPAMIRPTKVQDWANFKSKKTKMEKRLDIFLKILLEEVHIEHCRFLKQGAAAKERVLKQQSLVLTDYLEQLDEQISRLQREIDTLERKNKGMTTHVKPLLLVNW